jgi:hypothetical protein
MKKDVKRGMFCNSSERTDPPACPSKPKSFKNQSSNGLVTIKIRQKPRAVYIPKVHALESDFAECHGVAGKVCTKDIHGLRSQMKLF